MNVCPVCVAAHASTNAARLTAYDVVDGGRERERGNLYLSGVVFVLLAYARGFKSTELARKLCAGHRAELAGMLGGLRDQERAQGRVAPTFLGLVRHATAALRLEAWVVRLRG